jgi:hypothetical protein
MGGRIWKIGIRQEADKRRDLSGPSDPESIWVMLSDVSLYGEIVVVGTVVVRFWVFAILWILARGAHRSGLGRSSCVVSETVG